MEDKLNGKCVVCGNRYHICKACDERRGKWKSWKLLTDTPEHYQIFVILRDFDSGNISASDAKAALGNFDLSDTSGWNETILSLLQKVKAPQRKRKLRTSEKTE